MAACSSCGGPVTLIAAIEEPAIIIKILVHLGLSTKAPPRAPAQAYPLVQTALSDSGPNFIRFYPEPNGLRKPIVSPKIIKFTQYYLYRFPKLFTHASTASAPMCFKRDLWGYHPSAKKNLRNFLSSVNPGLTSATMAGLSALVPWFHSGERRYTLSVSGARVKV